MDQSWIAVGATEGSGRHLFIPSGREISNGSNSGILNNQTFTKYATVVGVIFLSFTAFSQIKQLAILEYIISAVSQQSIFTKTNIQPHQKTS